MRKQDCSAPRSINMAWFRGLISILSQKSTTKVNGQLDIDNFHGIRYSEHLQARQPSLLLPAPKCATDTFRRLSIKIAQISRSTVLLNTRRNLARKIVAFTKMCIWGNRPDMEGFVPNVSSVGLSVTELGRELLSLWSYPA